MSLMRSLVFASLVAVASGCSRDPIVFVAWPAESRYSWTEGEAEANASVDEARIRVRAAQAVAWVSAEATARSWAPHGQPIVSEDIAQELAASPRRIDLNTATLDELDGLPRIGPAMAQRIVDGRPFRRVEDLRRISGIGSATYAAIVDRVEVGAP